MHPRDCECQIEDFVTVLLLEDNYRWVQLQTADALAFEGQFMRNCLATKHFAQSLQEGTRKYFSLRDPKNLPHVTIMTSRRRIIECRGKANSRPAERYIPAIRAFVTASHLTIGYQDRFIYPFVT